MTGDNSPVGLRKADGCRRQSMPGPRERYAVLLDALDALPPDQETVTFSVAALEPLLGRRFRREAYRPEYWLASNAARTHWLRAGWRAVPDREARTVTFTRWTGRRPGSGPPLAWFRQLAAVLVALPAEQQTVRWFLRTVDDLIGRRLAQSTHLPSYRQEPAVRACWAHAGFTAHYDRRSQTVTFSRLALPG